MKSPSDPPTQDVRRADEPSFAQLLTEFEQSQRGDIREAVTGTVISITADQVFINIGRKTEGVIAPSELRDRSGVVSVKSGDTLVVSVTGRDEQGYYTLSRARVSRPRDWAALEKAFNDKLTIAGVVTEAVKGGLRVDVGASAFMPASRTGAHDQAELERLIGQEIQCRVTKLDTASEDVVVDRRVILEEQARQDRDRVFGELREGAVMRGTVRSLTNFGAFVDLGGVDGLLHVGEMSWHRIDKPSDVVSEGDEIDVKILRINPETRKIALGLKQLQPDPWTLAAARLTPGDRIRGKVVRLADFGAFIEIESGVDGLIHVSELSWSKKQPRPSDVLKTGELVEAVVLGVNAAERRIALGLKQTLGDPWDQVEQKFAVGSAVEGSVTNLTKFGAFVDLGDGMEGMIHIGDITSEKRLDHPSQVLTAGRPVRAQVLGLDRERRRIRLGMKQLEPTSADEYLAEHRVGDVVTGRVVQVDSDGARVELAEGVLARSSLVAPTSAADPQPSGGGDLRSLTVMLSAKWKQGGGGGERAGAAVQTGQIRSFRLRSIDAAGKRIELEPV